MPDQNKNTENSLEVVVKAIDGEALVLETPNGDLVHWPLNQLTTTLPLGQTLKLKLEPTQPLYDLEPKSTKIKGYVTLAKDIEATSKQSATTKASTTSTAKTPDTSSKSSQKETSLQVANQPANEDPKITRMRKMLENIING